MHDLSELLAALKKLNELQCPPRAEWTKAYSPDERRVLMDSLRAQLPTSLLGHHDRSVARGRRSLTQVQNGVCGACHLRLPRDHFRPNTGHDLDVCDNCGIFLEWPQPSITATPAPEASSPHALADA
jgi:hypothetical protein